LRNNISMGSPPKSKERSGYVFSLGNMRRSFSFLPGTCAVRTNTPHDTSVREGQGQRLGTFTTTFIKRAII
jgi:hypothetical protein